MLGWLVLAALAAAFLARVSWGYPRPRTRMRALFRGEAALLAGAAQAMYPPGGAIPPSGLDADIPGYIDRLMAASHPRIRMLLHLLVFTVEHGTLLFWAPGYTGWRRFSALTSGQQVAVLDAWARSPRFFRRLVFTSLRSLCTLGYFAHAPVQRQLGVAPLAIETPVCEADLLYPRIGGLPESIVHGPGAVNAPVDRAEPLRIDGPLHPSLAEGRR